MGAVKIGDYVLATKYIDGDPCDQWCIGFVSEHWPNKKRWLVRDSEGNNFRHNGFRRAETITAEAGEGILRLMQAGAQPDSMWRLRDAVVADIDTTAKGGA